MSARFAPEPSLARGLLSPQRHRIAIEESPMKGSVILVAGLLSFPFATSSGQVISDAQIAAIVVTAKNRVRTRC